MRIVLVFSLCLGCAGCGSKPDLTVHGKPVSHWIEAARGDKDPAARKKALAALGNVGAADPAVVPALIRALKDRDPGVRADAVLALLKIGPDAIEAVPALRETLRDGNPRVRAFAGKALKRIQSQDD